MKKNLFQKGLIVSLVLVVFSLFAFKSYGVGPGVPVICNITQPSTATYSYSVASGGTLSIPIGYSAFGGSGPSWTVNVSANSSNQAVFTTSPTNVSFSSGQGAATLVTGVATGAAVLQLSYTASDGAGDQCSNKLNLLINVNPTTYIPGATDLGVASGEGTLRIVRGHVASNGGITGSGFTVAPHTAGTGIYTINFLQSFADTPTIVASVNGDPSGYASTGGTNTPSSVTVTTFDGSGAGPAQNDHGFDFIAIGKSQTSNACGWTSPEPHLYLLRGSSAGGGGNFALDTIASGTYTLTFPAGSFTDMPAIVVSPDNAGQPWAWASTASEAQGSTQVYTWDHTNGPQTDDFDFIAVGASSDAGSCPVRYIDLDGNAELLRGRLSNVGLTLGGSGFTSSAAGTTYHVGFTTSFQGAPSAVGSTDDVAQSSVHMEFNGNNSNSTLNWTMQSVGGAPGPAAAGDFVAVGVLSYITSLAVSPATASVPTSATQQFTATYTGNGPYSNATTWSVNGVVGGNATVGTISATGLYTAPAAVPSPAAVTIKATSVQDATKSATATATVTAAAPPAPTMTLTANPTSITAGNSATLTWASTNATSCSGSWAGGALATNGNAMVSPAATTNYTGSCTGPGGTSPTQTATVTVTAVAPPAVVTIKVISESAVSNNIMVPASWAISGAGNPCAGTACTNQYAGTYPNLPTSTYTLDPLQSTSGFYALRSVERQEIAQNSNLLNSFLGKLGGWLFAPAFAENVCFGVNETPIISAGACPVTQTKGSVSLLNNGDTGNFIILWEPIPQLMVNPTTLALTAPSNTASTSAQISISNTGAQDSSLMWTSSVAYGSGNNWLTVLPSSGGPVMSTAPQTVTIIADPSVSNLAQGTYTATVTFTNTVNNEIKKLTVTFTVPAATGGNGNGNPPTITINTPQPTAAGVPVQMSGSGGAGPGTYTWTTSGSTPTSGNGNTFQPTYPTPGNYPVTLTSGGQSTSTTVVITNDCTFTASPTTIVPPQQSTLSWQCVPGTAAPDSAKVYNVTNGTFVGTGLPASSTITVSPTQNTEYQLLVTANGQPTITIPSTPVMVTVQGPGVIEGNPGG